MNVRRSFVVVVLVWVAVSAHAQSSLQLQFYEAVNAYESGDFDRSLSLLQTIERRLGGTNLRIQPYIIMNLIALELSDRLIMEEIRELETLGPPRSGIIEEFRAQLSRIEEAEDETWQAARRSDTVADYRAYLRQYPSGRFERQARSQLSRIERETYESVVRSPSQQTASTYFAAFPGGSFRDEIVDALLGRAETDSRNERWTQAATLVEWMEERSLVPGNNSRVQGIREEIRHGRAWARYEADRNVTNARSYIDQFPRGRNIPIIQGNVMFTADSAFERYASTGRVSELESSISFLRRYLDWFPDGPDAGRARSELRQREAIVERVRTPFYVGLPMRLGIGVMNSSNLGDEFLGSASFGLSFAGRDALFFGEFAISGGYRVRSSPDYRVDASGQTYDDVYRADFTGDVEYLTGDESAFQLHFGLNFPFAHDIIDFAASDAFYTGPELGVFTVFNVAREADVYLTATDEFVERTLVAGSPSLAFTAGWSVHYVQGRTDGTSMGVGLAALGHVSTLTGLRAFEGVFRFMFGFNTNPQAE